MVVITGPNGGGKSTLAKIIAGIIQPTEGTIWLDGMDITHMSVTERARVGISLAFQQPVRFKGLTVKGFDLIRAQYNLWRTAPPRTDICTPRLTSDRAPRQS